MHVGGTEFLLKHKMSDSPMLLHVKRTFIAWKFFDTFDRSMPQINHTNSHHKDNKTPWITKDILKNRRIKNKLSKNYLNDPTDINEKPYIINS